MKKTTTGQNHQAWKIRKIERREKQRQNNIIRAKEMHAFRIRNKATLISKNKLVDKFYVGCSGWFYWHWKGIFYSEKIKTSEWFTFYLNNFSTVELNAPFYSWPTLNTIKTWYRQANSRKFIYTIKVSELITHIKKFVGTKELIKDFDVIAELLGEKFGCFLYQLPPSFKFTSVRLKRIVAQLNLKRRNVVEFRHSSWWNEEVYKTFRQNKIIFCSCSSPTLPDQLVKTSNEIYIRFHGKSKWYHHKYSKQELKHWIDLIKKSKAKRIWAYFNNDREGFAIQNAKEFIKQLKKI